MVLRGATHFPRTLMPLYIFEPRYQLMLRRALEGERMFGVACAGAAGELEFDAETVRPIFTAGLIRACVTHGDGTSHLMLLGLGRVRIVGWEQILPYRVARIAALSAVSIDEGGEEQLSRELVALCLRSLKKTSDEETPQPIKKILEWIRDPEEVADIVGHNFVIDPAKRQELLEIVLVKERLRFLIHYLGK